MNSKSLISKDRDQRNVINQRKQPQDKNLEPHCPSYKNMKTYSCIPIELNLTMTCRNSIVCCLAFGGLLSHWQSCHNSYFYIIWILWRHRSFHKEWTHALSHKIWNIRIFVWLTEACSHSVPTNKKFIIVRNMGSYRFDYIWLPHSQIMS